MNIYKIYFNYIIELLDKFKLESKHNFDNSEILKKITLEPPKNNINGDMSTNLAMLLSKSLKLNPKEIANKLKPYILKLPNIALVDIAGPGFINITLKQSTWSDFIKNMLLNPQNWDKQNIGKGQNINLEYVSANPTGPLHAGHARGAVFGDALASLLDEVGYKVIREYYINDAGSQIEKLVESSLLRYDECNGQDIKEIPNGLYPGEYLKDVGKQLFKKYGKNLKQ
jgi:arginyl-tRNA synthetase